MKWTFSRRSRTSTGILKGPDLLEDVLDGRGAVRPALDALAHDPEHEWQMPRPSPTCFDHREPLFVAENGHRENKEKIPRKYQ